MADTRKVLKECRSVLLCHHRNTHKPLIERINKVMRDIEDGKSK